MSAPDWSRRFAAPIQAKRSVLHDLRDAANHIIKLPKAESARPHWQLAMRCLIDAAGGGIVMLAEIAMRKALAHGKPKAAAEPRPKRAKAYRLLR